ncbi:hypothetical protein Esti_000944 [Eimeria stiedai]
MEQSSVRGSVQGAGSSGDPPSQFSSAPNTARSSAPQVTYSLNAAGTIPGTRPARLIMRPFEGNNGGPQDTLYGESPRPEYMRFYNVADDLPVKKQAMLYNAQNEALTRKSFLLYQSQDAYPLKTQGLLYPPSKSASVQPTVRETPREMPAESYGIPPPMLESKYPKEQAFIKTWNEVDHAGAIATCRLERVPLPLLERIPGESPKFKLRGPLVRVQLPEMPAVEGDFRRFCQRIAVAFTGAAGDCRRLLQPCGRLQAPQLPKLDCCTPQAPVQQECKACGFKGKFCPECGMGPQFTDMVFHGAVSAGIPSSRGILVPEEGCLERCMRWHWSLFGEIGDAIDQEILCDRTGGVFGEFGEFVDNLVAEGIHAVSFNCAGLCSAIPGRSRTIVEGYPLYEPDPKMIRKERPTSATGNACVDQLNAFLDACITSPSRLEPEILPPAIPETQKTGNWLIDTANAALDYCLQDRTPPPPPPARKKICPVEMLIPPCCRERPSPVAPLPPKQPMCPFLQSCMPGPRECPQCHQPIKPAVGTCPREGVGGCRIQLCPVQEPRVTVIPAGRALVYPYKEEDFQVRDRSGLVEALDDHAQGAVLPQKISFVQPIAQY